MKIKDVEKQVGISKANIRFYEEEGLIHPARNQENNYREYSETDVEQLQEIKKLRLIGIPVQEIKDIYENRLTLQEALSHRLDEIEKEERTLKETKLTCQKALKWLEAHEIAFEERAIVEENPTYEELKEWHAMSGFPLKKFFNTSGMLYKQMQLKDKLPTMTEDEQIKLLATDGMLVKRPFVVGDGFVLTGFKEKEWEEKLLK